MTHNPQNNASSINIAIVLQIGVGSFDQGFPVTLQILNNHMIIHENSRCPRLPPASELAKRYRHWEERYKKLGGRGISPVEAQITHESSLDEYLSAEKALKACLTEWFNQDYFHLLQYQICAKPSVRQDKSVPVIFKIDSGNTEDDIKLLRKIPWHFWSLFNDEDALPNAEVVLSTRHANPVDVLAHPVRILGIFGSSKGGLELSYDREALERLQQRGAEITRLQQPSDNELQTSLWGPAWDILFFAGHSYSEPNLTSGSLLIRDGEFRSLDSLSNAIQQAVNRGLKLAIFNSCDGLGIANYLAHLGVPTMIVMREPVPDLVARKFLEYFLEEFSSGTPLYRAVRQARSRLQWLENDYSCLAATRLPVICQNPVQPELAWPQPPPPPPPPWWRQLLRRLERYRWVVIAAVVALTIIILFYLRDKSTLPGPTSLATPSPTVSVEEQISLGKKPLIQYKSSPRKTKGIQAIKRYLNEGKPQKNDPEAWIYLNNAIATVQNVEQNASIQKIAAIVYVPGDQEDKEKKWGDAEEILRGVAQEQTLFNCGIDNLVNWVESNQNSKLQCSGTRNKFLQVAIAIYHNRDQAKEVTQTIVNDPDQFGIGVVARYPSDILQQVAPIYQQAKRVVVAPTSNAVRKTQSNDSRKKAIKLNEYIFRMVPNSSFTAQYLHQKIVDKQLAVVYEHDNPYTESVTEEIELQSNAVVLNGEECNLKRNSNFNAVDCINKLQGISYVFIAPSLGNLDNALELIQHIHQQKLTLRLLGSDTVYDEDLLDQGGQAAVDTELSITVPWARSKDGSTPFEQNAGRLFGTPFINWRTAMAYDATLALIKGLENAASPEALQRKLSSKSFSVLEETATGTIRFQNGDRIPDNNLRISVQVVPDNSSEYKYNFQRNDNPT